MKAPNLIKNGTYSKASCAHICISFKFVIILENLDPARSSPVEAEEYIPRACNLKWQ